MKFTNAGMNKAGGLGLNGLQAIQELRRMNELTNPLVKQQQNREKTVGSQLPGLKSGFPYTTLSLKTLKGKGKRLNPSTSPQKIIFNRAPNKVGRTIT
jgi:hypothetical protein